MSDLISRNEVMTMLTEVELNNGTFTEVKSKLRDIPTVEARPVVNGEWEGNTCNACDMRWDENMVNDADDWGYFDPMPNFCPNCGADMRKKVE